MKRIMILIGLFVPCVLNAQQPQPSPQPLPPGPLLNRAPDFSKWVVTYNPPRSGQGKPQAQATPAGPPTIKQLIVTKTKNIYHEESVDTAGTKRDSWRVGNMQIVMKPGTHEFQMLEQNSFGFGGPDASVYTDYSKTDFPGLEWISAKNYVDVKKINGVDCIIFRSGNTASAPATSGTTAASGAAPASAEAEPVGTGDAQSPMMAYIDLASRLPVFFQSGDEVRVYQFAAIPAVMQPLPPELQTALEQRAHAMEEMTRRPPKPF